MFDAPAIALDEDHDRHVDRVARPSSSIRLDLSHGVEIRAFADLELVVATKKGAGYTAGQVGVLENLVRDVASGRVGHCKFLVFDLSASSSELRRPAAGFDGLVEDVSNLIFQVPVLSIGWARGLLSGSDLDLALSCSMLVGEVGARFGFDFDPVDSLRSYALLAHRLGFVRAERLMDDASVIGSEAAHDLMLVHSVVPAQDGVDGIRSFAKARTRRHNSSCGLYRAQRIAMMGAQ